MKFQLLLLHGLRSSIGIPIYRNLFFHFNSRQQSGERKVVLHCQREGRRPLSGPKQACQMFLTEFLSSPQLAQMIGATAAAKILWTVGEKRHQGEIMAVIVTIFHLAFFARVTPPREAKRDKYISMQIYFSLLCGCFAFPFSNKKCIQGFFWSLFVSHFLHRSNMKAGSFFLALCALLRDLHIFLQRPYFSAH